MSSFLDPSDGVFVNVNGTTGEMITDPNTGELKVVVGSNAPIGGGAGGTTAATASGAPAAGLGTNTLVQLLQKAPSWALPVAIFVLLIVFGGAAIRKAS